MVLLSKVSFNSKIEDKEYLPISALKFWHSDLDQEEYEIEKQKIKRQTNKKEQLLVYKTIFFRGIKREDREREKNKRERERERDSKDSNKNERTNKQIDDIE